MFQMLYARILVSNRVIGYKQLQPYFKPKYLGLRLSTDRSRSDTMGLNRTRPKSLMTLLLLAKQVIAGVKGMRKLKLIKD